MTRLGPVQPTASAISALRPLPLDAVTFSSGGLLGGWQHRNATRTLPHCITHLSTEGALTNLRRVIGEAGGDFENFWFADSDVHKTLEAAAWQLGAAEELQLRTFFASASAMLAKP